jgi:hypothetical protein
MADDPYITQADAEAFVRAVYEDTRDAPGIQAIGGPRTYRLIDRDSGLDWFDGTMAQFLDAFGHIDGGEEAILAFAREENAYVEITEHPPPVYISEMIAEFRERWVVPAEGHPAVLRRDGAVLYVRFGRQDG